MQQNSYRAKLAVTSSTGYQSAHDWLTETIIPITAGAEPVATSGMIFKPIIPYDGSRKYANDEACDLLEDMFRAVGFDPLQIVIRNNTVDFNIHYTKRLSDTCKANEHLPLYSIADHIFGICWTWDPLSGLTRGIVWHLGDEGFERASTLLRGLSQSDQSNVILPALFVLQIKNAAMRDWVDSQADAIRRCQLETGYLYPTVLSEAEGGTEGYKSSSLDLELMTRRISGLAVNIATSALCLQRLLQLADFILEGHHDSLKEQDITKLQTIGNSVNLVLRQTRSARRQTDGILLLAEALKHKSSIMVQTLLSLTSQHDQRISISIANHSRTLAEKATRDSTSMKAIAAVTMCFLPGTFVSSLFSTPMFDWDSGTGLRVSSQFWTYWAVTLPLTVVVVAVWLLWTSRSHRIDRREIEEKHG